MRVLPLQVVPVIVAQLGYVVDGMRILSYKSTLAETLVVFHQVIFGAKFINICHQLIFWDAPEGVFEHGIELVARDILSIGDVAGYSLLLGVLRPIHGGRARRGIFLRHGINN